MRISTLFVVVIFTLFAIMLSGEAFAKRGGKATKKSSKPNIENAAPVPMPADAVIRTEVMPRFKYGELREFRTWVQDKFKCPKSVYADLKALAFSEQAILQVIFYIDIDGSVKFVETRLDPWRNSALFENAELSTELARIMATSPIWTPAMQNGEPKRLKCMIPLKIDIW